MITIVEFKAKQATGSVDALWGQPIKLTQVASTSELCENFLYTHSIVFATV